MALCPGIGAQMFERSSNHKANFTANVHTPNTTVMTIFFVTLHKDEILHCLSSCKYVVLI